MCVNNNPTVHTWFTEMLLSAVCVCLCIAMPAPEAVKDCL